MKRLLVVETVAGRGGPYPTRPTKTIRQHGRITPALHRLRLYPIQPSMPTCPACGGSGEIMTITESGVGSQVCALCHGHLVLPRALYDLAIREMSRLSLETV